MILQMFLCSVATPVHQSPLNLLTPKQSPAEPLWGSSNLSPAGQTL